MGPVQIRRLNTHGSLIWTSFKLPMWSHSTWSWEMCTVSLCAGETFPEDRCLQTPYHHTEGPTSQPCLTFPCSQNSRLWFLQMRHGFPCYFILFLLFPVTAIPSTPPPYQSLHLNSSNSSFHPEIHTGLSSLESFLWNPIDQEILLELKVG